MLVETVTGCATSWTFLSLLTNLRDAVARELWLLGYRNGDKSNLLFSSEHEQSQRKDSHAKITCLRLPCLLVYSR